MFLDTLGEVIATRNLFSAQDPNIKITAKMGKPVPWDGGPDYLCPIQIVGLGDEKIKSVGGVDAFQAIELAVKMIAIELKVIKREYGIKLLRWKDDDDEHTGFPDLQ